MGNSTGKEYKNMGTAKAKAESILDPEPTIPEVFRSIGVPLNDGRRLPTRGERLPRKRWKEEPDPMELMNVQALRGKAAVKSYAHRGETVEEYLARGGEVRTLPKYTSDLGKALDCGDLGLRVYMGDLRAGIAGNAGKGFTIFNWRNK